MGSVRLLKRAGIKRMVNRGFRGWEIEYSDGSTVNEEQLDWKDASKQGMTRLSLHYDGREWNLCNKVEYYQKKRASVVPGMPGSFKIETRSIGYYDGNDRILYTVNEDTGRMHMEIEEVK